VNNEVAMTAKQISPQSERFAYPVNDACHALGIKRTSLYELAKTGQLRLIKIAGRTLVPRSEIERLTSVERAA
jgi:predicted site-specific integrase-resolvase